jgi:hypothetical protein
MISGVTSRMAEGRFRPAEFTATSIVPKRSTVVRARFSRSPKSLPSQRTATPSILAASFSRFSMRRAATTTRAPCSAKRSATAQPMPLDAPRTTATLFSSRGAAVCDTDDLLAGGARETHRGREPREDRGVEGIISPGLQTVLGPAG